MLLAAVLSDTVILSSPTTTDRDHRVVEYLEELLGFDARAFGAEMFEASSDVGDVPAAEIIRRDVKEYEVRHGRTVSIAQIETVGRGLSAAPRRAAGRARGRPPALRPRRLRPDAHRHRRATAPSCWSPESATPLERAFDAEAVDGVIELPGVMSRKKQVVPAVLAAF